MSGDEKIPGGDRTEDIGRLEAADEDAGRALKLLRERASKDGLTGLLNREETEIRIGEALRNAATGDTRALFIIDLDNFKQVNDQLGYQAGDVTLAEMAGALRRVFRASDLVGRLGGDEFMVFMSGPLPSSLIEKKAAEICAALQYAVGGAEGMTVTASVGVAVSHGAEVKFQALYATADAALYEAKHAGRNRFRVARVSAEEGEEEERAEASSAVQLQALLRYMDGGVLLLTVMGTPRVLYASPSYFKSFSRKLTDIEADGAEMLSRIYPEDGERVLMNLRKAAQTGEPVDGTLRVKGLGGEPAWRRIRAVRIPHGDPREPVMILVVIDATVAHRQEKALRESAERLRVAFDQTSQTLFEIDRQTREFSIWDVGRDRPDERYRMRDFPEGFFARGYVDEESREPFARFVQEMLGGKAEDRGAFRIRNLRTGTHDWTSVSYHALPLKVVGVALTLPAIAEERAALRREKRLAASVEKGLLATAECNVSRDLVLNGHFHFCGAPAPAGGFEELLRWGEGRLYCEEDVKIFRARLQPRALRGAFERGVRLVSAEFRCVDGKGAVRWVSASANLLRNPVSRDIHLFGYLRDIDRRKRWELDLYGRVTRDGATGLFSRETMAAIVHGLLRARKEGEACALALVEIRGLTRLAERMSVSLSSYVLYNAGRLFSLLLDGDCVIGRVGSARIGVFMPCIPTEELFVQRVVQARDAFQALYEETEFAGWLGCNIGVTVSAGYADCTDLFDQAAQACSRHDGGAGNELEIFRAGELVGKQGRALLIVDDAAINRALLDLVFHDDYTILEALDGRSALEILRRESQRVRAIVLDLHMPGMGGFELLEILRADPELSAIPVVVVTAADDPDSELRSLDLGAADFVVKPFDPRVMRERVNNAVRKREMDAVRLENRLLLSRNALAEQLRKRAYYDHLTDIYNREAFYEATARLLKENPKTKYLLARFNVERFRLLNELLGQSAGDGLLLRIAGCIRECAQLRGSYGRLEADHFALCMPEAELNLKELMSRLNVAFDYKGVPYALSVNAGLYRVEDASLPVDQMCDRANLALGSVKGNYPARYAYYDDKLREELVRERRMLTEMLPALRGGQFHIYLQPQYNQVAGRIVGAEALVRWVHPERGLIEPGLFLPVFEKNGFITLLDEYVWEEACRLLRRWLDGGMPVVPLAVNLSRVDVYNPALPDKLEGLRQKYGLPANLLRFEITESAYVENPRQLIEAVALLQKKGFVIEMDDFGSGQSSLNTLKDLPVNALKLDLSFLAGEGQKGRGGDILGSVVGMARRLSLPVIAEGVETLRQAEFLRSIGCDLAQGYLFGRPMPVDEFERLLREDAEK